MTISENSRTPEIQDDLRTETYELRCSLCKRLFTKISIVTSVSAAVREIMLDKNISISQIVPGIEIKIGTETKCFRCKKMDYKLAVI